MILKIKNEQNHRPLKCLPLEKATKKSTTSLQNSKRPFLCAFCHFLAQLSEHRPSFPFPLSKNRIRRENTAFWDIPTSRELLRQLAKGGESSQLAIKRAQTTSKWMFFRRPEDHPESQQMRWGGMGKKQRTLFPSTSIRRLLCMCGRMMVGGGGGTSAGVRFSSKCPLYERRSRGDASEESQRTQREGHIFTTKLLVRKKKKTKKVVRKKSFSKWPENGEFG